MALWTVILVLVGVLFTQFQAAGEREDLKAHATAPATTS
jgi:hypothetical protein